MSEPNWVPLGGQGVDYEGDWSAGAAYQAGDVVRFNGVEYLAVNPSTGQMPPDAVPGGISFGTSLPAAPVDGQEAILVDSLTLPTFCWRFRYVVSITDAAKWVGAGSALTVGPTAGGSLSTDIPTDIPNGPSLVVPRAGAYELEFAVLTQLMGSGLTDISLRVYGSVSGILYTEVTATIATTFEAATTTRFLRVNLAAGETLTLRGSSTSSREVRFVSPAIRIRPVRVA